MTKPLKKNALPRPCDCGCGELIKRYDKNGRERRFVYGHQNRIPTEAQVQVREAFRYARTHKPPWNKGKSYVISKRLVYANKGAWNKALRRLHPDRCMRCGWDAAPCDTHHITPKRNGGKYELKNGAILCPNCHRLADVGAIGEEELLKIKANAPIIGKIV